MDALVQPPEHAIRGELARFSGDVPWAHLDIAGTAWGAAKPYTPKGGSGWGVRLFVEVARSLAR